jgi:hypothetical protein
MWFRVRTLLGSLALQAGGTVAGAVVVAVLLFVLHEDVPMFQTPSLSGVWTMQVHTDESVHAPFLDMTLWYTVLIAQEGTDVWGTGEKVYEDSSAFKGPYFGTDRTRFALKGTITKRYFRSDTLVVHYVEEGTIAQSSTVEVLRVQRRNQQLVGAFQTTAGDSSGAATWVRGRHYPGRQ